MDQLITVLLATAAACGVTTVLAAVLLLAERVLLDYGQCMLDINEGNKVLEVSGGRSLLAVLKDQEIFIPSACGGRGTCAYCKLKITQGGGPVLATEEPLLTEEEIADNVRISCQVKVRNDLAIIVPDELFLVKRFSGVIERITDLTHDIKEVRINLTEPGGIKFTPGQYVQLEAPAYGDNDEGVFRAYSISSHALEADFIELIIRLVPGGICTTWVFEHLAEGDEIGFSGPFGDFRLSDSDSEMIWIAGGSGMAPFWSMIRYMKDVGISRKCTYFFGAVAKRDLFLVEELRALADELDWFKFVPALSSTSQENHWPGEKGLITEVLDRHVAQDSVAEAYLCGSPGMINAAAGVLRAKGIGKDKTFFDEF